MLNAIAAECYSQLNRRNKVIFLTTGLKIFVFSLSGIIHRLTHIMNNNIATYLQRLSVFHF